MMSLERLLLLRFRGAARLRALLQFGNPVTLMRARTIDGLLMGLDPGAFIDRFVIDEGYYERDVLDAILEHLSDNGVLWDVGANFGLHALTAKRLRPAACVVAFEPVPFMAARLSQNARLNGVEVNICTAALGASPSYERLSMKLSGNSGLSSFNPWPNVDYEGTCLCRVELGDDLVAAKSFPSPTVMKIDVEGYELQVLQGMPRILASPELEAIVFESYGAQFEAITMLLGDCGFTVRSLEPANSAESGHLTPNYIAVRGSR